MKKILSLAMIFLIVFSMLAMFLPMIAVSPVYAGVPAIGETVIDENTGEPVDPVFAPFASEFIITASDD